MDTRNLTCYLMFALATAALSHAQSVGGCPVLPPDNVWNTPIDQLPVDTKSATYVDTIGASKPLHADFSIPFVVVPGNQAKVPVSFQYADESDPGPYPVPPDAPIEGGAQSKGDRHVLVVDKDHCILYELYSAYPQAEGGWKTGSGAIFDLRSNSLRPATWTSSDAAGLPVLPGLVRYDEVAAGEIKHAIRFTVPETRREYVWPATHFASKLTDQKYPPMGERFRLRADFDISGYSKANQAILLALKKYGMILADNGSSWFISGAPDDRWDNDDLHQLSKVHGSDFEAVDESSLMVSPRSGRVKGGHAVVNGASWSAGPVAPGEIVTIYGPGLDATASVTFDGTDASVLFASADQINAVVPDSVAGLSTTKLQITVNGSVTMEQTVPVSDAAPGLFTVESSGRDLAAASQAMPMVVLYGTGAREADRVSVAIAGRDAAVLSASAVSGLLQVSAIVPGSMPSGLASVVLTVNGVPSRPDVVLSIQ
jgi:uncharacterized protein (TIGR03437 family)